MEHPNEKHICDDSLMRKANIMTSNIVTLKRCGHLSRGFRFSADFDKKVLYISKSTSPFEILISLSIRNG